MNKNKSQHKGIELPETTNGDERLDGLISPCLSDLTRTTCQFLAVQLPKFDSDGWWKTRVKAKLSYHQQRRIEQGAVSRLEDLDLAALIRVFDKNWFEISEQARFPDESLSLVRELQHVRNRSAHAGSEGLAIDGIYRDLDTIWRYLALVGADEGLLDRVDRKRAQVLKAMSGRSGESVKRPDSLSSSDLDDSANNPEKSPRPPTNEEKPTSRGVPLELLGVKAAESNAIQALLKSKTFVGIDFGTSTTVVSRVRLSEEGRGLVAEPISIKQFDDLGRCIENHLVDSCIAWTGKVLLVGNGAAQLKPSYEYGKNIWFSFKMKLGVDLGPQYFRSELAGKKGPHVIEKPQQAAAVFFGYLREQIEAHVAENNLPPNIVYSVSVPAAFEANQRQDLCNALSEAGIDLPDYGIIDEPNAAFVSYLMETLNTGTGIADSIGERDRRIMVFDFGAGTCDISVLEVSARNDRFASRNLAISQFHALGGDDVDRQIVRKVLLKQLLSELPDDVEFSTGEMNSLIVPRLQPAAESLKIQCCKFISGNWNGRDVEPFTESDKVVMGPAIEHFQLRGLELGIRKPQLSFSEFGRIMDSFVDSDESAWTREIRAERGGSIFEPVASALEKARIEGSDLDMVLFIGGSSLNPYVQAAVKKHFGRFVETVVLGDLRTPVSRGAALNSFMVNGLKCEIIRPITSETVFVVTAGGGLREILPAGSEIPSGEIFISDLEVQRDGQTKVELPICVTNEDKLLAVIEVPADSERPFAKGDIVTLSCAIDENKLLRIKAKVGNTMIAGVIVNPLANEQLTPEEARMLTARQHVYVSALENKGRPAVNSMLSFAYSCQSAGHFVEAAEAFEAVERLDPNRDFATTICYLYSRGDRLKLSAKWSEIAHNRNPSSVTAYNLALTRHRTGDESLFESLMEESIRRDPENVMALDIYGHHLNRKGNPKGISLIEKALELLIRKLETRQLDKNEQFRLRRLAETLGRRDVIAQLGRQREVPEKDSSRYQAENLAISPGADTNRVKGD